MIALSVWTYLFGGLLRGHRMDFCLTKRCVTRQTPKISWNRNCFIRLQCINRRWLTCYGLLLHNCRFRLAILWFLVLLYLCFLLWHISFSGGIPHFACFSRVNALYGLDDVACAIVFTDCAPPVSAIFSVICRNDCGSFLGNAIHLLALEFFQEAPFAPPR